MDTDRVLDWDSSFSGDFETPDFVLPGFLAGTVGAMVGAGGTGKSYLSLLIMLSITVKNLLGWGPNPGDYLVNYVTAEDPICILQQRANALGAYLSEKERDRVPQYNQIISLYGMRPELLDRHGNRNEQWIDWLKTCADSCRLIIIDTLRRFHQADENSSSQMSLLTQVLDEVSGQTGCSVLFVHHTSKNANLQAFGGHQNASRGSSLLTDNIRWQMNLTKMTKQEAKSMRIPEAESYKYVKLNGPKFNYDLEQRGIWLQRGEGGVLTRSNIDGGFDKKSNVKAMFGGVK